MTQCRVESSSILRYCSRPWRIWRQVRDRLSSVFRSIEEATDMMILVIGQYCLPLGSYISCQGVDRAMQQNASTKGGAAYG